MVIYSLCMWWQTLGFKMPHGRRPAGLACKICCPRSSNLAVMVEGNLVYLSFELTCGGIKWGIPFINLYEHLEMIGFYCEQFCSDGLEIIGCYSEQFRLAHDAFFPQKRVHMVANQSPGTTNQAYRPIANVTHHGKRSSLAPLSLRYSLFLFLCLGFPRGILFFLRLQESICRCLVMGKRWTQ